MWTLALETTSSHGSVALLQDEDVRAERKLVSRAYGSELFTVASAVLAEAGVAIEDIDLFAAADGPGSFTGVRIGLTAVKGWVEVLGRPAVTVSTLRAVAGTGTEPVIAALDGSRQEVYYGLYPQGGAAPEAAQADEELEPLAEFQRRLRRTGWRALTPHAELQQRCPGLEAVSPVLAPTVGRLGRIEYRAGRVRDALSLDARYIRRPDAVLP